MPRPTTVFAAVVVLVVALSRSAAGAPVHRGYLYPLGPLRIEAGRVFAYEGGFAETRCQLHNAGTDETFLLPGRTLDLVSVPGAARTGARFHDWDFEIPGTPLLIHCEFPRSADRAQVHPRLRETLAGVFGFNRVY